MPAQRIANERIPQGRYWSDVFEHQENTFSAWLTWNVKAKFVTVEHTESPATDGDPSFVIYSVTAETGAPWPTDEAMPVPNIAGPEIKSKADTVQRPDPEPDISDRFERAGKVVAGAIFALGVAYIAGQALGGRKSR